MSQKKMSRAARRKRVMRNRAIAIAVLVVIIIVIIVIVVSCNKNKQSSSNQEVTTVEAGAAADSGASGENTAEGEDATEEETTTAAEIKNEKPVNLYTIDYGTMTCTKVDKVSRPWSADEDLGSFGAFCSTENSFTFISETQSHKETWESIDTQEEYKIGYELSFDVNGDHKVITILKPGDIESNSDLYNGDYPEDGDYSGISGYLGVWVYDDLHQEDGAFYIHITQAEVNDDTLLTSIKLRPTPQSDEIDNLVLKGFSYSSDKEFDSDGHYSGNYAAQVEFVKE